MRRSDLRYDWLMTLLAAWFIGGAYIDSWAHRHLGQLETFFTPWHAILYSGFLATAIALAVRAARERRAGVAWNDVLADGYRLSALGALVFFVGGVGDMLWHIAFGIETSTAALLSPTHLLLACGAILMASGPVRAAWYRYRGAVPARSVDVLPAIICAAFIVATFAFFTQFASPFASTWASASRAPGVRIGIPAAGDTAGLHGVLVLDEGLTSILIQSTLLMGMVLYLLRDRLLLPGAMTVIVVIDVTLMTLMVGPQSLNTGIGPLIAAAFAAGVCADLTLAWLRPSVERVVQLRLFAFLAPVFVFGFYLITLAIDGGVWWSVHVACGIVVLAGVAGWLESFLLVPRAAA